MLTVLSLAAHTKGKNCCPAIRAQLEEMTIQLDKLQNTAEETKGNKPALRSAVHAKTKNCCKQVKAVLGEMKMKLNELQKTMEEIKNKTSVEGQRSK